MGNYVNLGPLALRVSTKGIADWGYPLIATRDYAFLTRDNGGGLCLAAYNPRDSLGKAEVDSSILSGGTTEAFARELYT